ncbi:MAG: glycosyltransferase family 39 protein, partial [Thermodesulfobacteriota bacterium]
MPFLYHNDEPIVVNYALSYGTGDFNPRMFNVPPLLSYLLFFEYGVLYLIGSLLGFFKDLNDFGYLYLNDPTIFHIIGRVTFGIVPGVLSVFFLYRLGKKIFNEHIGLIAAFFLAINFLHVRDSHYIYFDIPLTMCLIVFFIKSVDLIRTNSMRDYIWTGALIGIVTGIKYFGPLLTPFLVALLAHNFIFYRKEILWNIQKTSVLALTSFITFFILNPFAFLEYENFLRTLAKMPVSSQEVWFHFNVSLIGSLGLLMLCCGLIGWGIAVIKRNKVTWLLSIFVVSYYIFIVMKSQGAERYVMPLVPLLLLFAGYFTYSLSQYVRKPLVRKVVFISILCLLVFPSAYKVFLADKLFLACDTRTQAYNWIKQNVSSNAIIA